MSLSNLMQLRRLAALLVVSPLPFDTVALVADMERGELELALERLAGLGFEVLRSGELLSLHTSPVAVLLPRLKAIEAMAVHREVVTFEVDGRAFNLAGAVLYLAAQASDALYEVQVQNGHMRVRLALLA